MIITIITIIILIFSAILHEIAHGYAALSMGDDTAKDAGRLTLNPLAHLDPVGSVLLPLLLVLSKVGFFIAWAKPVPYNPHNLNDPKFGDTKVALAGPATNLILATISGLLARFLPLAYDLKQQLVIGFLGGNSNDLLNLVQGNFIATLFVLFSMICFINLILMIFNLLPIPPLDGSKVVLDLLPYRWRATYYRFESYGFILVLLLLWTGMLGFIINPLLFGAFTNLIGVY